MAAVVVIHNLSPALVDICIAPTQFFPDVTLEISFIILYKPSIGPNNDRRFWFQTNIPGFGFGSNLYPNIWFMSLVYLFSLWFGYRFG